MSDCIFCKIIAGEIPADIVLETDSLLAFRDINPVAPTHILIIPKKHYESLATLTAGEAEILTEMTLAVQKIAKQEGLSGWRSVINTGADGGQEVPHLHWHLIGGRKLKWEF